MPTPQFAPPTAAQVALLTRTLASPDQPEGTLLFQELRGFLGRNDRCPCGSGKKYRHCCLVN